MNEICAGQMIIGVLLWVASTMPFSEAFYISHILREFRTIEDTSAPLVLTDAAREYIRSLPDAPNHQGLTLSKFVFNLPRYAIRDGALAQLLPTDVYALVIECDRLVGLKQDAVANQDFIVAKERRDDERLLRDKINSAMPQPVAIEPLDVFNLLRTLGFDGDLPT